MTTFSFDTPQHASAISKHIINLNKKVVYISGSSASGKSYIAQKIRDDLIAQHKKVLLISSDSYYCNQTKIQSLIYGTFDHPHMIEHDLLATHIDQLIKTGSVSLPNYSFKEGKRKSSTHIKGPYDFIIVEGLYTIAQLPSHHDPLMVYIDSSPEELIFRRLIRDQERLSESLATQVINLAKVFPMRNVFGVPQKKKADIIINNNYEILSTFGRKSSFELIKEPKS